MDRAGETKMGQMRLEFEGRLVSPEQRRFVYSVTNQSQGRLL